MAPPLVRAARRARVAAADAVDPVPVQIRHPRHDGRYPLGHQRDHGIEVVPNQAGIGRSLAAQLEQTVLPPFLRRHLCHDLLGQDVQRGGRDDGRVELPGTYRRQQGSALDRLPSRDRGSSTASGTPLSEWLDRPARWRKVAMLRGRSPTWHTSSIGPMSMPSSNDAVATGALSSPALRRSSTRSRRSFDRLP